jgi:hypothetical protein
LRIQISDPLFFSAFSASFGLLTSWRQTSTNGQMPAFDALDLRRSCIRRHPSKNRELNVGDATPPSSFEGHGELKKCTNFIYPPEGHAGAPEILARLTPAFGGKARVE